MQLAFAQTLERDGETKKAIDAYERLANQKDIPQAMHRLGVLHDKQGNFDKASEYYRKALKHRPDDPDLLCDIGYSYYLQENFKTSETHLRRAVQIDPNMERAHNNLGLLFARTNQHDAALAAFRNAAINDEVALANFNYVCARDETPTPAMIENEIYAQPKRLVDVQPVQLNTTSKAIHPVNLSSLSATTDWSKAAAKELPPANPLLISDCDAEFEPVELADFSLPESRAASNPSESVEDVVRPDAVPNADTTDLVDPVKVEIPAHWSKFFPES